MNSRFVVVGALVLAGLGGCVGAAHRPEGIKRFDAGEYSNAAGWLKKEAADGDTQAMVDLGYMTQYGVGVPKNETAAEQLFQQAMSRGSVRAQTCLAVLYMQGSVISHDYAKALELLKDAYARGDKRAAYDISIVYVAGMGVPLDKHEAERWQAESDIGHDADWRRYDCMVLGLIEQHRVYPSSAVAGGYTGRVEVAFSIEDLRAVDARIYKSSGHPDLDTAALSAVSETSFLPP